MCILATMSKQSPRNNRCCAGNTMFIVSQSVHEKQECLLSWSQAYELVSMARVSFKPMGTLMFHSKNTPEVAPMNSTNV